MQKFPTDDFQVCHSACTDFLNLIYIAMYVANGEGRKNKTID